MNRMKQKTEVSQREEGLIGIVLAKNEFVLEITSRKKSLEKKIRDFREKIHDESLLREYDEHFGL